ncbi:MAG: CHAT domain-containing protein [Bacteroidota bacterium]
MARKQDWKVRIFHFAGHASGEKLEFTDLAVDLGALGERMARDLGTQLVFLNGCGTQASSAPLLKAGIPAVIATTAAVGDVQASRFARFFYEALSDGQSIEEAFLYAQDMVRSLGGDTQIVIRDLRHLSSGTDNDRPGSWILYLNENFPNRKWNIFRDQNNKRRSRRKFLAIAIASLCFLLVGIAQVWPVAEVSIPVYLVDQNGVPYNGIEVPKRYTLIFQNGAYRATFPVQDWRTEIVVPARELDYETATIRLAKGGQPYSKRLFKFNSAILLWHLFSPLFRYFLAHSSGYGLQNEL